MFFRKLASSLLLSVFLIVCTKLVWGERSSSLAARFSDIKNNRQSIAWQRWDTTLSGTKSYLNPYKEIIVSVTFTGPGNTSFIIYGFFVSGTAVKIRTGFPAPGKWTWRTTCSDTTNTGLHNRTGVVQVSSYRGTNLLYQKGFLSVSTNKRYLTYGDGTPFLWMGDTGWLAFLNAKNQEWQHYIDDRAAKGFTVIQICATKFGHAEPDSKGDLPFVNELPNNAYWEDLDEKIQYANEKGIVILLVGLGASGKGGYIPEMNTSMFTRYLTGHLAGNFVIFSPSMDAPYDKRNDEVGNLIKKATSRHLVTQHVGTSLQAAEEYHCKPYLDFTAMQSGHHNGKVPDAYEAARNWPLVLWKKACVKPVINAEGMYDGRGNNEGDNWREEDVRKVGWLCWLSGALGYTYGAGESTRHVNGGLGGVWMFNTDSSSYDYWRKVLNWKSASQMGFMKRFFAQVHWWLLEPASELIRNQSTDPLKKMVLAKSISGDLYIAYLPDNDSIQLESSLFSAALTSQWFDPVKNSYLPAAGKVINNRMRIFNRPAPGGDWILLIKKR